MISVIMPVYNGEVHLKAAIDSILDQTYAEFEFIIINDGSTDSSEEIILSYKDERIKYIINEKNLGIVKTLNKGIDLASNKYIVRMDADDISLLHRFEKQIGFMEANPDIAACGSNIIRFYNDDIKQTSPSTVILQNDKLKISSLFYTAFWHPTMILRSRILKDFNLRYRSDFKYAQDKALWIDISNHGALANIEEPLIYYRVHGNQVSTKFFSEQYAISMAITREALSNLGIDMSSFSDKVIGYIAYPQQCFDIKELYQVEIFANEVIGGLSLHSNYESTAIRNFIRDQIIKTLQTSQNIGKSLITFIYQSKIISPTDFDLRFFLKCLMKRNTKSILPSR